MGCVIVLSACPYDLDDRKMPVNGPEGRPMDVHYEGGLTRSTIRAAGITQEDAARRIGISRPQLANALQRRYGLSVEVASRLHAFLEMPPPVRQLELC